MNSKEYHLYFMNGSYAIAKCSVDEYNRLKVINDVFSVIFEDKCVSIIYLEKHHNIKENEKVENGYKMFRIAGSVAFNVSGLLSKIIEPLAKIEVSVLVVSSFDTDYIMIKKEVATKATKVLKEAGFKFLENQNAMDESS